jgi:RHS repeat-associated protein
VDYAYDAAGNPADPGTVVEPGNRLTAYDGYTLQYDAAGNMVRKTRPGVLDQTLEWNTLGQLAKVVTNGSVVTFGYDAEGRRVRKTSPLGTTTYLYDGDRIAAELDAAGNAVAKYYYFAGVDDPHSVERGGQLYYYLRDYDGNIAGLMNSAGTLVNLYRYGPFGATEVAQEAVSQPYRFAGREYDAETGLYFFRARYYDPALHRFISPDPTGAMGGRNAYTFLSNNPTYGRDPSGLAPCVLLVYPSNIRYARQYGVSATYYRECDRVVDWSSVQRMIAERFGQIFEHYSDPATEADYEAQMTAGAAQAQMDLERGKAALSNELSEKSCGWAIAATVVSGALDVMMVAPVVRGLGLLAKAGYTKIAAGWVIRDAAVNTERQIVENQVYHHIEREFLNDQAAALARRGVQTARRAGPAAAGRLGGAVIEAELNVGMQWQDFVIPGHYTVKLAGRAGAICGSQ